MYYQLPHIIIVVLLLSLQIASSNAYPGEGIAEFLRVSHAQIRFINRPYGGAQHILLDIDYMKYFMANSEKLSKMFRLKIAFYTLFYMIRYKMDENKEQLEKMKVPWSNSSFFDDLNCKLDRGLNEYTCRIFFAVCSFLRAKYELLKALNDGTFQEKPSWPSCAIEENAKKVVEENYEEIAEVILSDLLLSLQERKKLTKYLSGLTVENDQYEIEKACDRLIDLVGYPRTSLLSRKFERKIGILCVQNDQKDFYLLYESFFSNNSKIGKWRSKMILEVYLYNEWVEKFFKNQLTNAGNEIKKVQYAKGFLINVSEYWVNYEDFFWHKEKVMRNVTFRLEKDSENKINKLKEMLRKAALYKKNHSLKFVFLPCDKKMPFLWEEGPTDVSLFRALKICTTEVVEEYMRKFDTTKLAALEEMELTQLAKFILCMGKHLKKNNPQKNDEEMAKLHRDKMVNLLEAEGNGDEFGELLNKNKKMWQNLLDKDGKAKIGQLLNQYEYLTASDESFNSSASENGDQIYFDAKNAEINEANGKENEGKKSGQNHEIKSKKKGKEIGEIREEKKPINAIGEMDREKSSKKYEIKNDKKGKEIREIREEKKPMKEMVKIDTEKTGKNNNKKGKEKPIKEMVEIDREKSEKSDKNYKIKNDKKEKEIGEIREEKKPMNEMVKIDREKSEKSDKNYKIKNDKKWKEIREIREEKKPTKEIVEIRSNFEANEKFFGINAENDFCIGHSQYKKAKSKEKIDKRKNAGENSNENNFENQTKSPKSKGGVKKEETFGTNSPRNLKQKNENVCLKALNKMQIHKMEDLMDDNFLSNLYKKYFEDKLDEECVPFLHISLFGRAIETKRNFIERSTKNKILEEFNEKWAKFIGTNLDKFDTVQFLMDKLFFIHNELDKLGIDPRNEKHLNKAIEFLESNELMKIERNAELKNEKRQIMPIQEIDDINRSITTQFGPYQSEELSQILLNLHTHTFSALVAKNLQKIADSKESIETECQNEQNYHSQINIEKQKLLFEKIENLIKSVEGMEMMIKQQKIAGDLPVDFEFFPYNLIRTTKAIREDEIRRSKELIQIIAPFEMDQNKKENAFNLKRQIELIVGDWAKKFGFTKYQLLVTGSFLLGTELDGSDLDLLCVVPNEIKVDNFNGPNADSLYALLKKKLGQTRISCISGSIELLQIQIETIEIDLCFVPVPKNHLLQNGELLQDEIVEEMDYGPGILPLAGYRSAEFQLSLLSDRHKEFTNLLKIVKIWSKSRLIYSGIFGYLNGVTLSIMTTKICLLFPNAPLSFLLFQFFSVYSKWDWSRVPILLDQMTPITLNKIVLHWPPFIGQNPMTVITPKFPEQNASYTVNKFTLKTIVEELALANEILSEDPQKWKTIFKEMKIEENFENFAVIVSSVSQWENLSAMCALQRSKIRINLLEWANSAKVADKLDHYQLVAKKEQKLRCKMLRHSAFCCYWLVGLRLKAQNNNIMNGDFAHLVPIYDDLTVPASFGNYMVQSFYSRTENLDKLFREFEFEDMQSS